MIDEPRAEGEPAGSFPRRSPDPPPAPVFTERGTYGEPRPGPIAAAGDGAGAGRRVAVWVLGALLAVVVALWLSVLSVAQATDDEVALPALERGIAALTDVEALLDVQLEVIQQRVDAGAETLTVPGFPVRDATVRAADVTRANGTVDRVRLRDALLKESAMLVRTRGVDALRETGQAGEQASVFSVSGGIRTVLNGLSSDNHGTAVIWLWPLGAAGLLLGGGLLAVAGGLGRFVALGAALVAAAAPVLLGGLVVRVALGFVDTDAGDGLVEEFLTIARHLTDLPVRNALWLAAAGVAIALPAALVDALLSRAAQREAAGDVAG